MQKWKSLVCKFSLLIVCLLSFTACPASKNEFGADADYFVGLQKLNEGDTQAARQKLNNCIKKGSYYTAKESAKLLAKMGDLQKKQESALFLYKNFPDDDSLDIVLQQLKSTKELRKIIELTNNIDFETTDDAIIRLRIETLLQTYPELFEEEVYRWFTEKKDITSEHYQFYRDVYRPLIDTAESEYTPQAFAIDYRITLYKRDYLSGRALAEQLLEYFEEGKLKPEARLASDMGKAFLYGTEDFAKDADLLIKKAEILKDTPAEFYLWFYAGRVFERASLYYSQTIKCFENAYSHTQDKMLKDNALWYLLKNKLKISTKETISCLKLYIKDWYDPEYFDDTIESITSNLLVSKDWNSFSELMETVDGYATKESTAKVAYIYGRLIEEDLIKTDQNKKNDLLKEIYGKALDCGTENYYKIVAAYRLKLDDSQIEKILCSTPVSSKTEKEEQLSPADILLRGYAYFGYPDYIYSAWQNLFPEKSSPETGLYLADFLKKCGQQNSKYNIQSLRIAARSANRYEKQLTKEDLKLIYPQNFSNFIDTYAKKYDINTSVIYALIRSESFFDQDVQSSAGAVGLTQLMSTTAADVAQRLKVKEYSLTDPETNINFGTYYLSNLLIRREGSLLKAFLSYNAGYKRVSDWLNSSLMKTNNGGTLPLDLFLEAIPYAETREYGRKLISATVMYEYLYGNSGFYETVEDLLK